MSLLDCLLSVSLYLTFDLNYYWCILAIIVAGIDIVANDTMRLSVSNEMN